MNAVLLRLEGNTNGNIDRATERIERRRQVICETQPSIDWNNAKIIGREVETERKLLEGVMTLKKKERKERIPLNT